MSTMTPKTATNIHDEGLPDVAWQRVAVELDDNRWGPAGSPAFWLSTAGRDGVVHTTGVAALWLGDGFWFTSGLDSRKSRCLRENPRCTVACTTSGAEPGMDLVVEGTARQTGDADDLARVTAAYARQGWPAEPSGDAVTAPFGAPTAGSGPWQLWHVHPERIYAIVMAPPAGAMRFTF